MNTHQEFKRIWMDEYKIHSFDVDMKGRATLSALCRFMQESAGKHAQNLGVGLSQLREKNLIWVLSRQLIKMTMYPLLGETITIHTWPTAKDRLFSYRDFTIRNDSQDVIGEATTVWFAVDMTSRKPQRADSYFHIDLPEDITCVFPEKLKKLPNSSIQGSTKSLQVSYSDLDMNSHVNNVRYIDWILDSFSLDFLTNHTMKELEINYLSEALHSDHISVGHENNENFLYRHSIMRRNDNTELCRAKTLWKHDDTGSVD
jgi:medium-chain acyl-[acyl-carrier-protein] hydrolase